MIYRIEDAIADWDYVVQSAKECWDEVDQCKVSMEFDLDKELYESINDEGMLRYYTIRTDEGIRVGFASFIISPSLHNKGKFVTTSDCMYLQKEHRGCMTELLQLVIEDMTSEGVTWFSFNVKSWLDKTGHLGQKLGCTLYENVYQRGL